MRRVVAALLTTLAAAPPVAAQTAPAPSPTQAVAPDPALTQRIAEVRALLAGTDGDPAATFAPAFLAKVPAAQLVLIAGQLRGALGAVTGAERVFASTPWRAAFRLTFEKGAAPVEIAVDPVGTHQVIELLIRPPVVNKVAATEPSLDAVRDALTALPGTTGILLARLGERGPEPVLARNETRAFAIGSEFKLVILAELVRAVAAGERRWDDAVTLDGAPLPGGLYAQQPAGTKVSLRDLAGRMISVSDNSATDILLHTLGREKVEAMLPVVGIARPAGMRPFPGTLELFKLKGVDGGALGRRWAGLDEKGRRALLSGPVAAAAPSSIDQGMFALGKPLQIDSVEWFASPADMVRVMDWLRRHTESGPAAEARSILAINPGIGTEAAKAWRFLGYKGGSEPGVIAMTFLLQAEDGSWRALSASWNNPAAAVDEMRFVGLMARAVELTVPAAQAGGAASTR